MSRNKNYLCNDVVRMKKVRHALPENRYSSFRVNESSFHIKATA